MLVHAMAGGRFRGRVLDDRTGEPIAGARVLVYDGGAFGGTWSNEGGVLCGPFPSDADGRFETAALTLDRTVTIDVVAAGSERVRFPTRLQRRTGERPVVDVRLPPGGSVVGAVMDEAGAPVAGATVYVVDATWGRVRRDPRESDLPETSRLAAVRAYEGKSDGEGRFVVHGVAFGTDGCVTAFVGGVRSPEVTGARVAEGTPPPEVRLVMPAGGGLDVIVLGPDCAPVTVGEVCSPTVRPWPSRATASRGSAVSGGRGDGGRRVEGVPARVAAGPGAAGNGVDRDLRPPAGRDRQRQRRHRRREARAQGAGLRGAETAAAARRRGPGRTARSPWPASCPGRIG